VSDRLKAVLGVLAGLVLLGLAALAAWQAKALRDAKGATEARLRSAEALAKVGVEAARVRGDLERVAAQQAAAKAQLEETYHAAGIADADAVAARLNRIGLGLGLGDVGRR
jgi:hypothetical protein